MGIGLPFGDSICSIFTRDKELHSLLYAYYIPFIVGSPIYLLLMCSIHFVRDDARPKFASNIIIIIANVINLILNLVFMGPLKMGVASSSMQQ